MPHRYFTTTRIVWAAGRPVSEVPWLVRRLDIDDVARMKGLSVAYFSWSFIIHGPEIHRLIGKRGDFRQQTSRRC